MDMGIVRCENRIARALSLPILNLSRINKKFGTGYDLKSESAGSIKLILMDDCSKYGTCICTLEALSDSKNDYEFIHDIVSEFEGKILGLHEPN